MDRYELSSQGNLTPSALRRMDDRQSCVWEIAEREHMGHIRRERTSRFSPN